jgi:DNA invertase Pin-like site-specific DNA recombinase
MMRRNAVVAAGLDRVVGGYIRVSSKRQRDASDSPASQRQRLADAGCTVFYEDVVSGYQLSQRRKAAEFQLMWRAIASGHLLRLVATRLDRYARRDAIVLELAEHCERHGVEFVSLSTGLVDTSSASGWLNVKMQLVFAEHFSRQLSENVRHGYQGLHRQGIPACPASAIPWHLQRAPGSRHEVIKGEGWADARYAVEQVLAGQWGATDVHRYVWSRHQVLRTATSAKQWLQMPALQGHMIRRAGTPQEVVIRDCWPALVTAAEQEQVVALLARRVRVGKVSRGQVRALSGLCRCGRCGQPMSMARLNGTAYVRCKTPRDDCGAPMVRAALLERELHGLLGPHIGRLIEQHAERSGLVMPSPEVVQWRRELQVREAIPVEFRQPADQARIAELQGLISSGLSSGQPDTEAMTALRRRVLDVVGWFEREEEERNTDLRLMVRQVVVNPVERRVAGVGWADGSSVQLCSTCNTTADPS